MLKGCGSSSEQRGLAQLALHMAQSVSTRLQSRIASPQLVSQDNLRCHLIKQSQGRWNGFKRKALATKLGHVSWGPGTHLMKEPTQSCHLPFRSRHGLQAHKIISKQTKRITNKSGKQVGQSQRLLPGPCHLGEGLHMWQAGEEALSQPRWLSHKKPPNAWPLGRIWLSTCPPPPSPTSGPSHYLPLALGM